MAHRPYWKGYLKFALVTCPIALHSGIASGTKIQFNQLNPKTGNRLRQQMIDEVTGEPVDDKDRGYQYAKGQYLVVEDEELDAIRIPSDHTIEITSFIPREQIDAAYFDKRYFLTPSDKVGLEAFAVIREAMRGKDLLGLAHVVIAKREHPVVIEACGKGLVATTLRYPAEVRDPAEYFDEIPDVKLAPDMLKLAEQIMKSRVTDFDPSEFVDHYEVALAEMLRKKQAGIAVPKGKPADPVRPASNIMEQLRASVAAEPKAKAKKRDKVAS